MLLPVVVKGYISKAHTKSQAQILEVADRVGGKLRPRHLLQLTVQIGRGAALGRSLWGREVYVATIVITAESHFIQEARGHLLKDEASRSSCPTSSQTILRITGLGMSFKSIAMRETHR